MVLPSLSPMRDALPRMAICLLAGAIMFFATFGAIGLAGKVWHDGWREAIAGMVRVVKELTAFDVLRLASVSALLSLIACFPVYAPPRPWRHLALMACAVVAALAVACYFSFEAWYWYGQRAFPPAGLVLALTAVALLSSYAGRTVLGLRMFRERP
jgi:hypothetical protein